MAKTPNKSNFSKPGNDEVARMMAYAQTDECKAAIARADAEIAAGKKIVADDAWFKTLSARRLAALGGSDPNAKAPPRRRPRNR